MGGWLHIVSMISHSCLKVQFLTLENLSAAKRAVIIPSCQQAINRGFEIFTCSLALISKSWMCVDKWIQFRQREMMMQYLTPKSKVYILFILLDSISVMHSDLKIAAVETAAFSIILLNLITWFCGAQSSSKVIFKKATVRSLSKNPNLVAKVNP